MHHYHIAVLPKAIMAGYLGCRGAGGMKGGGGGGRVCVTAYLQVLQQREFLQPGGILTQGVTTTLVQSAAYQYLQPV